ncbi:MAG: hypothetical protein FIB01_08890 [Gemmatimonadetes bacterium]|nr:hypothetical protein [Gemmatimonadota bacterium]
MKVKDEAGFVALVADPQLPPAVAARMAAPRTARLRSYPSVEELVQEQSLGGLRVLVIWTPGVPKGRLLPLLARLNLEQPWVQKIAMLEVPPPLVVAEYLTYCGVEVIWTGSVEERVEQLNVLMNRSDERTQWLGD